jgi:hypothetical protein
VKTEELQAEIATRSREIQPRLADYKRLMTAWIEADKALMVTYGRLGELIGSGEFGFNLETLQRMQEVLEADVKYHEVSIRMGNTLNEYGEAREELRAYINKLAHRMSYEMAGELTKEDIPMPEHDYGVIGK